MLTYLSVESMMTDYTVNIHLVCSVRIPLIRRLLIVALHIHKEKTVSVFNVMLKSLVVASQIALQIAIFDKNNSL